MGCLEDFLEMVGEVRIWFGKGVEEDEADLG